MNLFKIFGEIAIKGIEEAEKALDGVAGVAEKVGGGLQKIGTGFEKAGKTLAPVSAAASAVGVASTKMAIDFEDAMAKVSTIADSTSESGVPLEELEKQILSLSDTSGIAASEIADNVYNAISAGQETGDAVAFVEKATQLAKAGFTDSASALDILSTVMNAYGMEAEEVTKVSDVLIQTQNLGKTTVGELASAMGKVIPTAKANNVSIENLASMYAVMTSNGIATAETTTYLNSMLNELGKQGTTAADAFAKGTEHIKEGGLTMAEAMEMGWELTDVLSILDEQAAESGTTINNMFGSAEAGKAAAVLWDQGQKLNEVTEEMAKSAGSTDEAFKKMDTTSNKMRITINKLKNTGIELGGTFMEMLAPAVDWLGDKVEKLSTWFNSLDDTQKKNIGTAIAVVAAVAPVLLVIGKVISGIGTIITVISSVMTVFAALNPVVLIVVAVIAALAAGIVICVKHWDELKAAGAKAMEAMMNAGAKLSGWFDREIVEPFRQAIENVKEMFRNFKITWPHVPLPHFSVSPAGWKVSDLLHGIKPSLGIEWYAKGGIFDKPTLFDTATGLKGVGEAGAEAVTPISVLQDYVAAAVASQNSGVINILTMIYKLLASIYDDMPEDFANAIASLRMDINNREFARLVKAVK